MNLSTLKWWFVGVAAALLWLLTPTTSYAQDGVEFSITYDSGTGVYSVYMRPNVTPADPNETTTAQVTIKVPTAAAPADQFVPVPSPLYFPGQGFYQNPAISSMTWFQDSEGRAGDQTDDLTADYLSWRLTISGDAGAYNWAAGQEVLVFSFTNSGACLGAVELLADSDPFAQLPNSIGTNPGNQIGIRGIGTDTDNDYIGIYGSPANCVAGTDTDGDGLTDDVDLDDDNDGIPDTVELATAPPSGDTDGDGIIDSLDLDSDNDGLLDVEEAGHGEADANNDGRVDGSVGTDGIPDAVQTALDPNGGAIDYTVADTDGDGAPDFQDLDSDDDGINDVVESNGTDADDNGMADGAVDADGVPGSVPAGGATPVDTDSDTNGTPD